VDICSCAGNVWSHNMWTWVNAATVRLKKYCFWNMDKKIGSVDFLFFFLTMVLKYANLLHTFFSVLPSSYILLCHVLLLGRMIWT